MGWLLASGNQINWIRPTFQDNIANLKKLLNGQKAAWGDDDQPVDANSWFSIAYAPDQQYWIAHHLPNVCRVVMKGVTGSAIRAGGDLQLFSQGFEGGSKPALILEGYKYALEATAKWSGNAARGEYYNDKGVMVAYRFRTRFVRQLDASLMTPDERICEMTEVAINDPNFSSEMKAQFGMLADPKILLATATIIGLFVGIGAGAEFLGGAAFAAAVRGLLGVTMQLTMVKPYIDAFAELRRCVFSDKQEDFLKGAKTIQGILTMTVRDIAMVITMHGAMKLGSKAMEALRGLFVKYAPEEWLAAGRKYKGAADHQVAKVRAALYGYAAEHILQPVLDPMKIFLRGEATFFLQRAAREGEMIVIRGPSIDRMAWLEKLSGWLEGKPEWIKAKSWHGWHGLLCIPKVPEVTAALKVPKPAYQMGNLKGVFEEVDRFVDSHPTCPSYQVPYGLKLEYQYEGKTYKAFDWDASGPKRAEAAGYRLVDLGDRYLIVDSLGRPVCQDLDLGAIQRIGTPAGAIPGSHLPSGLRGKDPKTGVQKSGFEDNFEAEDMMNWKISQETGYMYNTIKHGGAGGSARHRAVGGAWTPRPAKKDWNEELYVFLPVSGAGKTARLFKINGWGEMEKFWNANKALFGSDFPF